METWRDTLVGQKGQSKRFDCIDIGGRRRRETGQILAQASGPDAIRSAMSTNMKLRLQYAHAEQATTHIAQAHVATQTGTFALLLAHVHCSSIVGLPSRTRAIELTLTLHKLKYATQTRSELITFSCFFFDRDAIQYFHSGHIACVCSYLGALPLTGLVLFAFFSSISLWLRYDIFSTAVRSLPFVSSCSAHISLGLQAHEWADAVDVLIYFTKLK